MTLPTYVLARTPGAEDQFLAPVREWEDICHSATDFQYITHLATRSVSRWTSAPRKRPFIVTLWHRRKGYNVGASATLVGAVKLAQRLARDSARDPDDGKGWAP